MNLLLELKQTSSFSYNTNYQHSMTFTSTYNTQNCLFYSVAIPITLSNSGHKIEDCINIIITKYRPTLFIFDLQGLIDHLSHQNPFKKQK